MDQNPHPEAVVGRRALLALAAAVGAAGVTAARTAPARASETPVAGEPECLADLA